jgi:murein DD-endopeptidase MepM/ murein hydrolase activator NlpD
MMGRFCRTIVFLFTTILIFIVSPLKAQTTESSLLVYESLNDSIDIANEFYDIYDSTAMFLPASEIYESWDNEYIHYPNVDFSQKLDTTIVRLVGGSLGAFSMPRIGRINSEYGWRKRRFHYGIDIDLETGDSVKSVFDGVVRVSRYHKGYGNVIVIRHFNGLETFYGHLSVSRVVENQYVKAGEFIAFGGSTGRSTGPHLHFETRYMGTPFNPRKIINFEKLTLQSDTLLVCRYTFDNKAVPKTAGTQVVQNNGTQNYSSKGAVYHIIKKGETLSYLASKYGTTVTKICQLSGISAKSILQIGQKVRVK